MERKFVFVDYPYTLNTRVMFDDLRKCEDVIYQYPYKHYGTHISDLINNIKKFYTRGVSYSKLFSFLKPICEMTYQLSDIEFEDDTQYYIIFVYFSISSFSIDYIENLKRKNVKPCLLILNPVSCIPDHAVRKFKAFGDFIFTFDNLDSKKYGYIFVQDIYSIIKNKTCGEIEKDIYFVGAAKERVSKLLEIFEKLDSNKINCDFNIVNANTAEMKHISKINYVTNIPYSDALDATLKSNCILEILQAGQNGATLRYYEAVCYNKKLLTNNKDVVNLPFYNPEYIHVFEKPEDIDCQWVKERIPIDYGYDGRFSPVHLLDKIVELDNKKEGLERG